MKWIGQHIYDLVSRFRSDIYLESISSGTIASGGNLGLDSNNKIVKQADTGITDLHGAGVDGSANQLLTDDGDGTVTSETYLTFENTSNISTLSLLSNQDTGDYFKIDTTTHGATTLTTTDDDAAAANLKFVVDGYVDIQAAGTYLFTTDHQGVRITNEDTVIASDVTTKPRFIVKNTTDDASSPRIILSKRRENGSGTLQPGEDGDGCGKITFQNYDDNSPTPGGKIYSAIEGFVHDATNNEESGQLKLQVSAHDGDVEDGIILTGGSVDAEVDVTVGKGSASVVTIPGHIDLAGDIDVDGTLEADAITVAGTALTSVCSPVAGHSSITTVGTISDGTWEGTTIAIDQGGTGNTTGVQGGKNYRILNCSFRDDIGTTKHYLPFKSQDEQTVLTREEVSELAVCDGRVVSVTLRVENLNTHSGDATVTFGVETNVVGTGYDNFTEIETEAITVNDGDDSHLYHAVFSTAKHWDSTDMFAISITSDTDISGSNERFFVTVVVEDDWSTYLAGSTREIDTTP